MTLSRITSLRWIYSYKKNKVRETKCKVKAKSLGEQKEKLYTYTKHEKYKLNK